MTIDRIALHELLEKGSDTDLLCEMIGFVAQRLMDLEAEGYKYAIGLKANAVLQERIDHLLTRPAGHPPNHVRRFHISFNYQAGSWLKKRRVVAKVEWHPGELHPPCRLHRHQSEPPD